MGDRRLLILVCAVVLVETLFFAALIPLLPQLRTEFGLSKSGIGVLSGAYPAGGTLGALAGAWLATRVGVRPTTVIGMVVLGVCCAGFGLARQVALLDALRFAQGAGGTIAWTGGLAWLAAQAAPNRRGEMLGTGVRRRGHGCAPRAARRRRCSLDKPPPRVRRRWPSSGWCWPSGRHACRHPRRAHSSHSRLIASALRRQSVVAGFWLIALPSLLFGALTVLAPLSLDAVGVGALGMTIFWLVSAAMGAVQSPLLGRWSDRRGRVEPVRVGLAASIAVSLTIPFASDRLALIVLILLASLAYNSFWVPGGALADRSRGSMRARARLLVRALQPRLGARRRSRRDRRRRTRRPAGRRHLLLHPRRALRCDAAPRHPGRVAITS